MYEAVESICPHLFAFVLGRIPYIFFGTNPSLPTIPAEEMGADDFISKSHLILQPKVAAIIRNPIRTN